jgi:hypothetical protein
LKPRQPWQRWWPSISSRREQGKRASPSPRGRLFISLFPRGHLQQRPPSWGGSPPSSGTSASSGTSSSSPVRARCGRTAADSSRSRNATSTKAPSPQGSSTGGGGRSGREPDPPWQIPHQQQQPRHRMQGPIPAAQGAPGPIQNPYQYIART